MSSSNWWHAIAGISLFSLCWSILGSLVQTGSVSLTNGGLLLLYALSGLLIIALIPIFYAVLYVDIDVVRASDSAWNPSQWLWIGGGILLTLVGYAIVRYPFFEVVGALYLYRRFHNPSGSGSTDAFDG